MAKHEPEALNGSMSRARLLAGVTSSLLTSVPSTARSEDVRTITVGGPSVTANDWAVYVAEKQGIFAANGLRADVVVTGSAAAAAQQVTAGSIDVAEISTSQAIEAIEGGAPLVAVIALSQTVPYLVVGKKGVTSLSQLKGKTVLVGGPNDITRVFMDEVLQRAGLRVDDYTYTFVGSTGERYAALVSGAVDATILNPPFSFRALGEGYTLLSDVHRVFPRFVQGVYVSRSDWARSHADLLTTFLRAYLQGVRWLYDSVNQARAVQVLSEATNTKPDDAQKTYDFYIKNVKFYPPTGHIEADDVARVQQALVKTNQLKLPLAAPAKYIDNRYVDRAAGQLRSRR